MAESLAQLAAALKAEHPPVHPLHLAIGDFGVRFESSSEALIAELRDYLRHFVVAAPEGEADLRITAIDCPAPDFRLSYTDWQREPGKKLKEEFADIPGGRVIHKVRTGMHFLLSRDEKLAVGPCVENPNQIVNFINSQYITWLMHRGYALCHAAAVVQGGQGLAIAAISGGGKSTLALQILGKGPDYTSNDRLLVHRGAEGSVRMSGVPKFPRINPGTALNNPALVNILPEARRAVLSALPTDELWDLEEKYDVDVDRLYPGVDFVLTGPLTAFVVLTWDRRNDAPMRMQRVELSERPDILKIIMKPPGPFYEPPEGEPPIGKEEVEAPPYLENLAGVPVYEISGGIDFAAATEACLALLK